MEDTSLLWASAILGVILNFLTLVTMIGGAFWWAAKFSQIVEDLRDDVREGQKDCAETRRQTNANTVAIGEVRANCVATHRERRATNAG
jgi:hypothetical protein